MLAPMILGSQNERDQERIASTKKSTSKNEQKRFFNRTNV